MKSLYFTEEHELFRQSVRAFMQKEVVPHLDQWEEDKKMPRSIWEKMGKMGYLGIGLPEKIWWTRSRFLF